MLLWYSAPPPLSARPLHGVQLDRLDGEDGGEITGYHEQIKLQVSVAMKVKFHFLFFYPVVNEKKKRMRFSDIWFGHIRQGQNADVLSRLQAAISCVRTWAATIREPKQKEKDNFFFGREKDTAHNQSKPSPFPDDEILISLSGICFGICRLPVYRPHMIEALWQCELGLLIFAAELCDEKWSNPAFWTTEEPLNAVCF